MNLLKIINYKIKRSQIGISMRGIQESRSLRMKRGVKERIVLLTRAKDVIKKRDGL